MGLAFFDTCSRHPDETNRHFVFAEKMAPVRGGIRRILAAAERINAPVLSTTCLGVQRCTPGMCVRSTCAVSMTAEPSAEADDRRAFVAMTATTAEIAAALRCREIVLERKSCKTAEDNVRLRTIDVFGVNKHTATIVRALGDRHWLVFGAGFEHCLIAAIEGLRALGLRVTVLSDGCIHGGRSTPATFLKTFERMKSLGAEWASFEAVCKEHGFDESVWQDHARARSGPKEPPPIPVRPTAAATGAA